ncbi:PEP-CTERM sorting domain-containing protein [Massilia sp. CCM 8694]|uniref:PEP-CTERM sorting domain-containing protein n=2 Tax=Massilia genomosp. 1 TaxID=2609280 RepID=A0ABX0MNZ4_9BURK|nr:PEP-CTERM sorting domain-containing protein [Massilia genomosp. 1]
MSFLTFSVSPSQHTVSSSMSLTQTLSNGGWDGYYNRGDGLTLSPMSDSDRFSISLYDQSAAWLPDGRLPEHLSLAGLSARLEYVFRGNGEGSPGYGSTIVMQSRFESLTEVSVTPVPEPGTWAMLLAGLGILGLSSRRKRA